MSDKTTSTTASSINVTTSSSEGSAYTSIQEGATKLRLKRTKSKTSSDAPEAATSPYIDVESVEEESHGGITIPPSISLTPVCTSELASTSIRKSPFLSISNVTSLGKRKREEVEEEQEENEEEEQGKIAALHVKAKRSCRPPSSASSSQINRPRSSMFPIFTASSTSNYPPSSHQLTASSQQLPTNTTTQNFLSLSNNPTVITSYRAPLCSTIAPQSPLQQLMSFTNTYITNTSQPLTTRYLSNPQTVTTATITNPRQSAPTFMSAQPTPTTHVVSLPQPTDELPLRTTAFMNELRRIGNIQARNVGVTQPETPYLFYQHQADTMQSLLPLDRDREQLAFRKLLTIQNQIDECQARLTLVLNSGQSFVRNEQTKRRLNIIVNRLTSHLVDLKNVASGIDAVINPNF